MAEQKAADAAKDGAGAKVWKGVGTVIAVLIGVVVMLMAISAIVPMIFQLTNQTLDSLSNGLFMFGMNSNRVGQGLGIATTGIFGIVFRVLFTVAIFVIAGIGLRFIVSKIPKKGGGATSPPAPPAGGQHP